MTPQPDIAEPERELVEVLARDSDHAPTDLGPQRHSVTRLAYLLGLSGGLDGESLTLIHELCQRYLSMGDRLAVTLAVGDGLEDCARRIERETERDREALRKALWTATRDGYPPRRRRARPA